MGRLQNRILGGIIRALRRHITGGNSGSYRHAIARMRRKGYAQPKKSSSQLTIGMTRVENCPVYTLTHTNAKTNQRVLFFHGGAYVMPIDHFHWHLLYELALSTGRTMTVALYPLAPESTATQTVAFATRLYQSLLLRDNTPPAVMGDSAGGGLAVAMMQALALQQLPLPEQAILLSPWVNVTMRHPDITRIAPHDPMLSQSALIEAGQMYAGNLPTDDVRVSPAFAEQVALPASTHVFIAGQDILTPEINQWVEKARTQGNEITTCFEPNMYHDWPILPQVLCHEAKIAKQRIIQLLS